MNIKVPSLNRTKSAGGGSTFIRNLEKALKPFGHKLVEGEHDIFLIAGATLCERSEFEKSNKPKILRVDNILEDRKNRGTGMSRMREFAEDSNVIVYQSDWAQRLLAPYCGEGMVIRNGVDTDVFYPKSSEQKQKRIFYGKLSRNEIKNFHEVLYFWREYNLEEQDDVLVLAGQFSEDMRPNFEMHNSEKVEHHGIVGQKEMADIMRSCDVAFLPYFGDACSNVVLECQSCGLPILYNPYGGTTELVEYGMAIDWARWTAKQMVDVLFSRGEQVAYRRHEGEFNFDLWKDNWGLDRMGREYDALFKLLTGQDG